MQLERKIRLLALADPSFQNIGQDLSRTYMMLLGGSYYGQRLTEVCSNLHYAPDLFADCSFMCREHYRVRNTEAYDSASLSRRPAHSTYLRLTHKPWASYGYALGLSDWRLVSGFDCVGTPE